HGTALSLELLVGGGVGQADRIPETEAFDVEGFGFWLVHPECTFHSAVLEDLLRRGPQLRTVVGSLNIDGMAVSLFENSFPLGLVGRKPRMMNDHERTDAIHQEPGHQEQTQIEV